MKRIYESVISHHLEKYNQMIFLGGPRQVGKTTIAKNVLSQNYGSYLNWDILSHRDIILNHLESYILKELPLILDNSQKLLILDEIHKYKDWKNYLKGLYDAQHPHLKIIVTGSARLNIYKKGGDSLMGRYFPYNVHPFSVRELISAEVNMENPLFIHKPHAISQELFEALWKFGGFPEPLLKQDMRFHTIWRSTRFQQLFHEDIRDMGSIKDLAQLELVATIIEKYAGQLLNYTSLAKHARVTDNTIRRWLDVLENFYFCYRISPWSNNITRSLLKEPKIYLWDWSSIEDIGVRFENFIASHLLKAVYFWKEIGLGDFGLYFCRTKDQKEVDFLVTKNKKPWMLVEAKYGDRKISPSLQYFQKNLQCPYAFQVILDMPYVEKSCFDIHEPIVVPARTFLSQLV